MNYIGKFDARSFVEGPGSHSNAHLHANSAFAHAPSDAIIVPDAHLLFNGDFKRSGVDLILSKDDRELVLQDYFKGEKRAALSSPDGAQLTGDLVNALTGHVEYAQAGGAPDAAKVIGHVTKLTGNATAIRNGVSIILNQGDNVAKGDVVQAGSDSQLGITFIDGTVFGLSSNARMVLNEMVYDPSGSNNSSLLSLVAGTISFVAGETAKHGDMKINTPVATMGIRGTAVLVEIDFDVPAQGGAPPVKFQVLVERDGHTGSYVLYSLTNPNVVIGTVNQAGQVTSVTGPGEVSTSPAPPLSPAAIAIIGPVFEQFFQNNVNPQSNAPPAGSTPPSPPPADRPGDTSPINNLPVGTPTTIPIPIHLPGPTHDNPDAVKSASVPVTITVLKAINVTPVVDTARFKIADHVTITDSRPSDRLVPYVPDTAKIVSAVGPEDTPAGTNLASLVTINPQTGAVKYDPASFAFLKPGETVTITIGFDSRAGTDTFHETLILTIDSAAPTPPTEPFHWTNSSGGDFADPTNWGSGPVPGSGDNAAIDADGTYTVTIQNAESASVTSLTLNNANATLLDEGTLALTGTLTVTAGTLVLDSNGTIKGGTIVDNGSDVQFNGGTLDGVSVSNSGIIQVGTTTTGVILTLDDGATITGGTLSIGSSSTLDIEPGAINSLGAALNNVSVLSADLTSTITVGNGSTLTLSGATISGGIINDFSLVDSGSVLAGDIDVAGSSTLNGGVVLNNGLLTVEGDQTLTLNDATISGGTINDFSLVHSGSVLAGDIDVAGSSTINGGAVLNKGNVTVESGVTLTLDDVMVNGTAFTGTGTIDLGQNTTIFFQGTQTFDNATVAMSPGSGSAQLFEDGHGTLTLGPHLTIDSQTGSGELGGNDGSTIVNDGTIDVSGGNFIIAPHAFTNNGTITAEASGGTFTIAPATFTNDGTISVSNGDTLFVRSGVTGTGSVTIGNYDVAEFDAGVGAGQTVTFADATGKLVIDTPRGFAGKIAGISGSGDVLDLRGGFDAAYDIVVASTGSFDRTSNTTSLVVTDQTKYQSVTLKLVGDLSGSTWTVTSDEQGGADITVNPVVAHDDVISNASAPAGDGWVLDTNNGHYYRLVSKFLSWDDAKVAAQADGGYLATVTSQAEQDFIRPLVAGNRAWLGGESIDDANGTGHFFWLTGPEAGTAFGFTHWRPGEPNGGFGAIEAVHVEGVDDAANGGWNDAPTDASGRDFLEEWGGLSNQIAFREGAPTTIATSVLLANDTDLDNKSLTVTSIGDGGHSLHGGMVSLDGNVVIYTPAANFSGADSFSYMVSDGCHTSTATVSFDVSAPVIVTDHFSVTQNPDGTNTISGLQVSDPDPAASSETFTVTATTGAPGSSVTPQTDSGSLSTINYDLASGVTYDPGTTPPPTDKVTLTVADSFGATDTVNFVFNEAGTGPNITLQGTAGKDVIFATGNTDMLTGGGGQDQFVFKPTSSPSTVQHTITDFVSGLDKIDVRQFGNIGSFSDVHETQQGNDVLITLDALDTVLLKNVALGNLHATSDFIFHPVTST